MNRVALNPTLLRWARERTGLSLEELAGKFRKLSEWEAGEAQPTLKQVEAFARAVRVPVGYLFLSAPPEEQIAIPDFRTRARHALPKPSPDLLEMIYACQERQSWYREFARVTRQPEIRFVNSATLETPVETVAAWMREELNFQVADRRQCSTWTDALRLFIRQVDDAGVLVMVSGVVRSNNHRRLDPAEFRGFALSDSLAPLVFVNGADAKAGQMFTLAHELAHLWLGSSALSGMGVRLERQSPREEAWCNAVAAEFLIPLSELHTELHRGEELPDTMSRLARIFKVSTLVVLQRLLDAQWIDHETFESHWVKEFARLLTFSQGNSGGGDFYKTTLARVSRRFVRALVGSTAEGQTLYRDAFRMMGISKMETFREFGRQAGVLQ